MKIAWGVILFVRHTRGLTLTEDGQHVLEMVRPLLDLQDKSYAALSQLTQIREPSLRLGLSTAFEQGVFAALESQLTTHAQKRHIVRHGSPELARMVRRGKLDAALVALPLETSGLSVTPLGWQESLIVALPALWPEAALPSLSLMSLSHRPLFWFKRERNPAFFDYTRHIFSHAGYSPACIEEPLEHDVLLARIAQGEGLSLLPASFSAIQRRGVIFLPLTDTELRISTGLLMLPENVKKLAWLQTVMAQSLINSD